MKKIIPIIMIISLCMLIISGCINSSSDSSNAEAGLKLGTYKSEYANNSEITSSSFQLNKDGSFTFTSNLFESNIILGKYEVNKNALTLNAKNGDMYFFEIKEGYLIFQKESSSDISIDDKLEFHLQQINSH